MIEYVTLRITTPDDSIAAIMNEPADKWDWASLLDCMPDEVQVTDYLVLEED